MEVFRRFQPDEPSSDHDGFLYVICLCVGTDPFRIIRRPHLEHTRKVLSLDGQFRRRSTCGDHQLVVRTGFRLPGLHVF